MKAVVLISLILMSSPFADTVTDDESPVALVTLPGEGTPAFRLSMSVKPEKI